MDRPLMVELLSGSARMAEAFRDIGFSTLTVDIEEKYNPDIAIDIFKLDPELIKDARVIWASPPCNSFSVASIGTHWGGGEGEYVPKSKNAGRDIALLGRTVDLITKSYPCIWFIENPVGVMRKMWFMRKFSRYTITQCQYRDTRMKPTDIWSNSWSWKPRPMCKNNDRCHEEAPRGSKTGTQGLKDAHERGKLPIKLCE